jgi:hypothetical protein
MPPCNPTCVMLLRISRDTKSLIPLSGGHEQKCTINQNCSDRVYSNVLPQSNTIIQTVTDRPSKDMVFFNLKYEIRFNYGFRHFSYKQT